MESEQIVKLTKYIEENLRASPTAGISFVDARQQKERLSSQQNHVVFGRRGAGKTSLLKSALGGIDHVDVYLNLEDYKDITFPNIVIHILAELFSVLKERINCKYPWYKLSLAAWRVRRRVEKSRNTLWEYRHEPDTETQEVREKEAYRDEVTASIKSKAGGGGATAARKKAREVTRQVPKDKLGYLLLELSTYKKLIRSISDLFQGQPIFLVLDDFYFVPKAMQPDLIDYFHRLTKGTGLFIKMATIQHRSKLYRRANDRYVGVERGHDIFEVDMDYTLDNFDELQKFMRRLLENSCEKSGVVESINELFSGDGFSQLCLASGGVPRDFLSLFITLAENAATNSQGIGKVQVTEAAIANIGSKLESMHKDSGDEDVVLDGYLSKIKEFVYNEKRTNVFLVAKDELDRDPQFKQAIRELVDLRLVHLVDHNTSRAPSDGRRYEAYLLDIGLYDNPKPRSFTQIEPGQRDDKARKDSLRASPVLELTTLREPLSAKHAIDEESAALKTKGPRQQRPVQLELGLSSE
jgi:hypothetical protein